MIGRKKSSRENEEDRKKYEENDGWDKMNRRNEEMNRWGGETREGR